MKTAKKTEADTKTEAPKKSKEDIAKELEARVEKGDIEAIYELGELLMRVGKPIDYPRAFELHKRAADDHDHAGSHHVLGSFFYRQGYQKDLFSKHTPKRDLKEAERHLVRALALPEHKNHPRIKIKKDLDALQGKRSPTETNASPKAKQTGAQNPVIVGTPIPVKATAVDKESENALKFLRESWEKYANENHEIGLARSSYWNACSQSKDQPDEHNDILKNLQAAADKDKEPLAFRDLGIIFRFGFLGLAKNDSLAASYFEKGTDNDTICMLNFARYCHSEVGRIAGITQDPDRAWNLVKSAESLGHKQAKVARESLFTPEEIARRNAIDVRDTIDIRGPIDPMDATIRALSADVPQEQDTVQPSNNLPPSNIPAVKVFPAAKVPEAVSEAVHVHLHGQTHNGQTKLHPGDKDEFASISVPRTYFHQLLEADLKELRDIQSKEMVLENAANGEVLQRLIDLFEGSITMDPDAQLDLAKVYMAPRRPQDPANYCIRNSSEMALLLLSSAENLGNKEARLMLLGPPEKSRKNRDLAESLPVPAFSPAVRVRVGT
ncbi:MAG TPA: hypothetical protein VGZ00_04290 [Candidatus Baltobacteraceae bacterium]|jgi:TPR repeat protein|nr:hypothetical protein [Candidatus Baltobacteraceae bacterium]